MYFVTLLCGFFFIQGRKQGDFLTSGGLRQAMRCDVAGKSFPNTLTYSMAYSHNLVKQLNNVPTIPPQFPQETGCGESAPGRQNEYFSSTIPLMPGRGKS
jgi:hypothetical protein